MKEIYMSVFPIVQEEESAISIAGTAILIECDKNTFLITAAHVLQNNGNEFPLYLGINDKFIALDCQAYMSKIEDNLDLDIAIFDIALNCQALYNELLKSEIKTFSIESPEHLPRYKKMHYLSIGFPWRRSKYNTREKVLSTKPLQYFSDEVSEKVYIKNRRAKENFLLVDYRRRKSRNSDKKRQMAPKPQGVSGGPIFTALVDEEDNIMMLIFEGILIEWRNNEYFVATRKLAIKEFLIQNRLCIQR